MATSSLTGLLGSQNNQGFTTMGSNFVPQGMSGNVQSGVGQVQQGASVIGNALDTINSAVGNENAMKKGGSVNKSKISTHQKSKKSPTW